MVSAFLSQGQTERYIPKSTQISGILKQMQETMENTLKEITATENQAIADYEALVAAKEKEIATNSAAIESKTERSGETAIKIVAIKEDLDDTSVSLAEDKKFLADLKTDCKTKEGEWEARSKSRTQELLALADTIKILNDDDALELFKKTLPSPALLQTQVSNREMRKQALQALKGKHTHRDTRLELIALALKGQTNNFDKIIKMMDDMVALLGKEQSDDDEKKAYCQSELDKAEDDKKVLDQKAADLQHSIDETSTAIKTLTEEIAQ